MRNEDLQRIISDWSNNRERDQCIDYCKEQSCLRDAVNVAALAINSLGCTHPHQRRWSRVLPEFADVLLTRIEDIERAITFDEIHSIVSECGCTVRGIGELAIYDTAVRIGMYKEIKPQSVYLHCGSRVGAENLFGCSIRAKTIDKESFPEPFQELECYKIENILCNRRHKFKTINE